MIITICITFLPVRLDRLGVRVEQVGVRLVEVLLEGDERVLVPLWLPQVPAGLASPAATSPPYVNKSIFVTGCSICPVT